MFERLTIGLGSEGLGYRPERYAAAIAADEHARARPRGAPPARRAVRRAAGREVHRLPDAERAAAGPDPGPGGRAWRRSRPCARRSRPATSSPTCSAPTRCDADSEWAYMISFLPGLKSAGGTEEILRNTIGERVLGPAARAAPGQGHPVQRAARQGARAAWRHEPRADRRAELPARGRARRALAREDRRGRARRARGPGRAARPVADGARGRLAGPARQRGARRRRAERVRRDARHDRGRPRAGRRRSCSATCRRRALLDAGGRRAHRARSPRASCARASSRRARRATSSDALDGRAAVGLGARRPRRCSTATGR